MQFDETQYQRLDYLKLCQFTCGIKDTLKYSKVEIARGIFYVIHHTIRLRLGLKKTVEEYRKQNKILF